MRLDFHSSSYDWLVVAADKAKYKGDGIINGEGEYKFMLTAIDSETCSASRHGPKIKPGSRPLSLITVLEMIKVMMAP